MHTLRCFGRLGVEGSGGAPVRLRSRKHLALLAYLVLNPDREHPRDRLASMLWETERTQARHSLSQALYDIRSNLPTARFDTTVNHVALEAGSVDSEAERFEAAVRSGDAIEAVRLYRGPFAPHLEGVATAEYERWVEDERNRLQRLAELAFYRYVIECDDRARWGEMCTAALRLLEMNPLNEEAHRAFMRGMWLQGDQHGALEHFRRIQIHLKDELPTGLSQETLRLVERIRSSRPDTAGPEPATRDRPRLVGRREEFSLLKDALGRLEVGAGGVVVLRGEAGIGKTRLLEEVRDLARLRGIQTLESRCFAAESEVPYGPVVEGLASVAADPARENGDRPSYYQLGVLFPEHFDDPGEDRRDELEADAGRRRLFEETAMLLGRACDRTPRLWIVENLHWIDASSAALLHYVSRRLRDRPLLLLVSVRDDEALEEATQGLVDDWCGQGKAICLELDALSEEEVGDLVGEVRPEGLPEPITATIQRLAGGNPFFALEMVSAAADLEEWGSEWGSSQHSSRKLMTRGLRSLIGVRLKGLDLEAVRLLETIAILERHARPFLVARTTNMSTGRVAEIGRTLYSRGLLHDEEGRLEFPHDITREYVYSNMGELQRAALHLVAGEVLAGSEESVSPSTLARHFALGGDRPRAYEYSLRAAEQSAHSYAHEEAIDLATMALSQSSNPRERAAALKILAEAESATGKVSSAAEHLSEAISLDVDGAEEGVELRLLAARLYTDLADSKRLTSTLEQIEERLPHLGTRVRFYCRMEALQWQLKLLMREGSFRASSEIRDEIQGIYRAANPEELSDRAHVAALYSLAAYSCFHESGDEAISLLNELADLVPSPPAPMEFQLPALRGAALLRLARWDQAEFCLRAAVQAARAKNDVLRTRLLLNNLLVSALEQGEWAQVDNLRSQLSEMVIGLPQWSTDVVDPLINQADLHFYRGEPRKAQDVLEALIGHLESNPSSMLAESFSALGLVKMQLGDLDGALRLWKRMQELPDDHLRSVQDQFKRAWFSASMVLGHDGSLDRSLDILSKAADRERGVNVASFHKIRWIQRLFVALAGSEQLGGEGLRSGEEASTLRESGLGWFVYFAARWFKVSGRYIRAGF